MLALERLQVEQLQVFQAAELVGASFNHKSRSSAPKRAPSPLGIVLGEARLAHSLFAPGSERALITPNPGAWGYERDRWTKSQTQINQRKY